MQSPTKASDFYVAQVETVLKQRHRLRGPQPPGDLFNNLPPNHPLLLSDPKRPLDPNLQTIADEFLEPTDVLLDVGGGSGRYSLPLSFLCREVINVDISPAMLTAFVNNAERAGIKNIRSIEGDWLEIPPPQSDVTLVAHTTYLVQEIVLFLQKVQQSARRQVLILVNDPPPPSWSRKLYECLFGEKEEIVPGVKELVEVIKEMGIDPQVSILKPMAITHFPPLPNREAAMQFAFGRLLGDQWGFWPLAKDQEEKFTKILEPRFEEFFKENHGNFIPTWIDPGHEVLITWQT